MIGILPRGSWPIRCVLRQFPLICAGWSAWRGLRGEERLVLAFCSHCVLVVFYSRSLVGMVVPSIVL
jgi:hypothetical protein